jgi:hypothetical protein
LRRETPIQENPGRFGTGENRENGAKGGNPKTEVFSMKARGHEVMRKTETAFIELDWAVSIPTEGN